MAGKYKELAEVLRQECIAPDIYSMWLQTDKIAEQAVPGQFISVYSNDGSRLLPRPISLCEIDKEKKALRIVYRVAGAVAQPVSDHRIVMVLQSAATSGKLMLGYLLASGLMFLLSIVIVLVSTNLGS